MRRAVLYGLCLVLLFGGGAAPAQPADSTLPPSESPTEAPAPAGNEPQARGLFLIFVLPLLGHVIEKTADTLFEPPKPPPANPAANGAAAAATPISATTLTHNGAYYTGLAFEVHLIQQGIARRVDPTAYVFHTGDRFLIKFMPNVPGIAEVTNINPKGNETVLGNWPVQAGQRFELPARGSFRFDGTIGEDILRIAFTPCAQPSSAKDVTIDPNATVIDYAGVLASCGSVRQANAKMQELQISMEGGIGYAVSAFDPKQASGGDALTEILTIHLHHQPS